MFPPTTTVQAVSSRKWRVHSFIDHPGTGRCGCIEGELSPDRDRAGAEATWRSTPVKIPGQGFCVPRRINLPVCHSRSPAAGI